MFSSIVVATYCFLTAALVDAKVSTANLRNKAAVKTSVEHRRVSISGSHRYFMNVLF
jgi:hypothetical protein